MPSIDALIAAIRSNLDQVRHLIAGLEASREQTTEVQDRLGTLGAEGSAAKVVVVGDHIEEGQAQAAALADRLEAALATAEAARTGERGSAGGEAGGSAGGGGRTPPGPPPSALAPRADPSYPRDRPHPISWSDLFHVCHGDEDDETKGGHLAGTGRPGKKEFPPNWDDEDVRKALVAVSTAPDVADPIRGGKFYAIGVHRGVEIAVMVQPDGRIEAGWPRGGPGVRTNPNRRES